MERRIPQNVPFGAGAELIQKRHEHQCIEDMWPDVVVPDILKHEDEHKGDDHIAADEDPETDAQPPEHKPVGIGTGPQRQPEDHVYRIEIVAEEFLDAAIGHDRTNEQADDVEKRSLEGCAKPHDRPTYCLDLRYSISADFSPSGRPVP